MKIETEIVFEKCQNCGKFYDTNFVRHVEIIEYVGKGFTNKGKQRWCQTCIKFASKRSDETK
jgi:hypothetical protein